VKKPLPLGVVLAKAEADKMNIAIPKNIKDKKGLNTLMEDETVCIFGSGYVGLPLAKTFMTKINPCNLCNRWLKKE